MRSCFLTFPAIRTLGNGSLSFADSSGQSWTGSLTLSGTLVEKSVRFGSDRTGLTAAQVSAITYSGGKVRLDNHGYLTANPQGTVILIQ